MVGASLRTGMTAMASPICTFIRPGTGVGQTPDKHSSVYTPRREAMHEDHGWRQRHRLDGKPDVSTDGLAQVVERWADTLTHGDHGRGHTKRPQATVLSGQVGHRGKQGPLRAERVCYTCQFHSVMLRISTARQIGH